MAQDPNETFTETAYAKINLALHIRGRRDDGYHELETIFAFLDRGDELSAKPSGELTLEITGPFAGGLENDGNLVLTAAKTLQARAGIRSGAHITLVKNLPIASGIGGGSADAAAALRLLNRLWQLELTEGALVEIGRPLGADVGACVLSRPCFGSGIGDRLSEVNGASVAGLSCLLVNPRIAVPTGPVFQAWAGIDRGPVMTGDALQAAQSGRNDLQPAALEFAPVIGDIIGMLDAERPRLTRMSGSGATCFALFASSDAARNAERKICDRWPEFWTLCGKIHPSQHRSS